MKFHFIIDNQKIRLIDSKNLVVPPDTRLILITDDNTYKNIVKSKNYQGNLHEFFIHIEIFNFEMHCSKSKEPDVGYVETCFDGLKVIIEKLKSKYIGKNDEFYITSNMELANLDCSRLREFFQVSGSKPSDVMRFVNKDLMKKHLLSQDIPSHWMPKHLKFNPDSFLRNQERYVNDIILALGLPIFIKPINGTGSVGTCKVNDKNQLIAWGNSYANDAKEYEIGEYIEGTLYHIASVIKNNQLQLSFVSRYLNPCGEAFLNQKLLGSIIMDQQDPIALEIKEFNQAIINAMLPIEDCVTHHEVFRRKNGELVFLEISNRVIEGGRVAEMFHDQFNLNLREIDYKLRLGIPVELTLKEPDTYHASVASISRKNFIVKKIILPTIKSQFHFTSLPINTSEFFDAPWDFDISCNDLEIQLWNKDYQILLEDFDSLKNFTMCEYEQVQEKAS